MHSPRTVRPTHPTTLVVTSGRDHENVKHVCEQSADLTRIERYVVPTFVLDVTRRHAHSEGARRQEAALVWAGAIANTVAMVTTALLFASAGSRQGTSVSTTQTGLLYAHAYARGLTLLAQVHSHPRDAFHSDVDERSPHSAERGFLSVVIPNFGNCRFDSFDDWAVFEQESYEQWRAWDIAEKARRLDVLDSAIVIP